MSLRTGVFQELTVERKADFGYFLSDGTEDVLLHFSELNHKQIEIGQKITVFLYNDHQGRMTATLEQPKIKLGEVSFLQVVDFHPKLGFFLDLGIHKHMLLPLDELSESKALWPKTGDFLLVKLVHDKQGRLLVALVKEEEEIQAYRLKQKTGIERVQPRKDKGFLSGFVIRHLSSGTLIYLETNQIGFLHRSEQIRGLRLGEKVQVRVTLVKEDGKVNVSMRPSVEKSRIEDAEMILEFLKSRGGMMPYTDQTSPDIIRDVFHLSKAAFKRALGKLMKDGMVYQVDGWTHLKK